MLAIFAICPLTSNSLKRVLHGKKDWGRSNAAHCSTRLRKVNSLRGEQTVFNSVYFSLTYSIIIPIFINQYLIYFLQYSIQIKIFYYIKVQGLTCNSRSSDSSSLGWLSSVLSDTLSSSWCMCFWLMSECWVTVNQWVEVRVIFIEVCVISNTDGHWKIDNNMQFKLSHNLIVEDLDGIHWSFRTILPWRMENRQ